MIELSSTFSLIRIQYSWLEELVYLVQDDIPHERFVWAPEDDLKELDSLATLILNSDENLSKLKELWETMDK